MRSIDELRISGSAPPPTSAQLTQLEELWGGRLPDAYLYFLQKANGGHPELDTFHGANGSEWSVDRFLFVGNDPNSTDSVEWNYLNRWEGMSPKYLPFAKDGGDNLFILNAVGEYAFEVIVWIHGRSGSSSVRLTADFESFIDGLSLNADYI